ncbi:ABC transporter permease [Agromyces sp. NPDC057679]|uniref:ABC transporter permease n=1 Tax=Agromyces sp. NPDC057679 TaxID=3346207 RepID=UPI003672682F
MTEEARDTEAASPAKPPAAPTRSSVRTRAVLREAIRSAAATPVASILTVVMIAGMCAAVLLTSGRTVAAEQAVIGSIDSAGTRSIIVRAEPGSGVTSDVMARISTIDEIEWAAGFGPAVDVRNAAFPGGTKVPFRLAYGDSWAEFGIPADLPGAGDVAYASGEALTQLGLTDPVGGISTANGTGYAVAGRANVPSHLAFLEPMLIAPQASDAAGDPVGTVVVIAERPDLVAPVSAAVESVLQAADPSKVSVQTSEDLAKLRAIIEGQLGSAGRGITLGVLALTAALTAAILYGFVMMRRKDYGRRRALGASQNLIIGLLLTQTAFLAALGATLGTGVAAGVLLATGDPLPGAAFMAGVAVLAVLVGVAASLIPAFVASRREPISELRVA